MITEDYKKMKIKEGEVVELLEELREEMGLTHYQVSKYIGSGYYFIVRGKTKLKNVKPENKEKLEKFFKIEKGALSNATDEDIKEAFRQGKYEETLEKIRVRSCTFVSEMKEIIKNAKDYYDQNEINEYIVKYACDEGLYDSEKLSIQNLTNESAKKKEKEIKEELKAIKKLRSEQMNLKYKKDILNKRVKITDDSEIKKRTVKGKVIYMNSSFICVETDRKYKECFQNINTLTKIQLINE